MEKVQLFFAAGTVSPMMTEGPVYLLDGTAFEALPLVVCAKGQMNKKSVDTYVAPSFYLLG